MSDIPGPSPLDTLRQASRVAAQQGPQDPQRSLPQKIRSRLFDSLKASAASHSKQIEEGPSAFDDLTYAKAAFVDVAGRGFVDTLLQGGVGLVNLAGDIGGSIAGHDVPDLKLDFMDVVSGFNSEAAKEASAAVDDVLWRGEYDNTPLRLTRQGAKVAGVTAGFVMPGALPHQIIHRGGQAGQFLGRVLSQPVQKFIRNSEMVRKAGLTASQADRLMRTGQLWTHLAKNSSGMGGAGKRLLGVLERNGVTPAAVLGSASGFALLNYLTTNQTRDPETGDVIPFTLEDKFSAAQTGAIAGSFMPILQGFAARIESKLAAPGLTEMQRAELNAAQKWLQDGGANLWNRTVAKGLAAGAEAAGFMGIHRETWEMARAVWSGDLEQGGDLLAQWAGTAFVLWAMRQGRGVDAYREGRYQDPDANRLALRMDADYIRTGGDKPPPNVDPVMDRYSAVMFRAGAEMAKVTDTGLELTMPGVKDPIVIRPSTEGGTKHPIEVELPEALAKEFGFEGAPGTSGGRVLKGDLAAGILENIAMRTLASRAAGSAIYGGQGLREVEVGSGVYISKNGLWLHSVTPEGRLVRRDATDPEASWEVTGEARMPTSDRLPADLEPVAEGWREVVDNLREAGLGKHSLEALSTTLATAFGSHGGHRNIREIQQLLREIGSPQEFAALLTPANARAAIFELASVAGGSMNARLAYARLMGEGGILRTGTSSEAPGPGSDLHGYLTAGVGTGGESTVAGVTRVDRSTTEGRRESREAAAAAAEAGEIMSPTDLARTFGISRETARALISRAREGQADADSPTGREPGEGPTRRSGEEGMVATDLLTLPIEGAANLAVEAGRAVKRFSVDSLLDRVEAQGGEAGKDLAQRGRRSTDFAKQMIGRLVEENLPVIRRSIRNTPEVKELKQDRGAFDVTRADAETAIALAGESRGGGKAIGRAGESLFVAAVEGRLPPDVKLSPQAQEIVDTYRKLVQQTGAEAQTMRTVQSSRKGDRLFTPAEGGKRLLRSKTQEALDIETTPGPAQDVLLNALAQRNNISVAEARKRLGRAGEGVEKTEGFEGTRELDYYPSWIEVNGERIELLRHAQPDNALVGVIESSATRLGQIREFGQDLSEAAKKEFQPEHPGPTELINQFEAAGGNRQQAVELLRALSGRATTDPILKPGSLLSMASRRVKQFENARAVGLLTQAIIPNLPEGIGGAAAFLGVAPTLKAMAEFWRSPKTTLDELAALGVVHRPLFNLVWREGNRMDAIVAGLNKGMPTQLGLRAVQRHWDAVAALMARNLFIDAMNGHRVSAFEATGRILKFTPEEMASVLSGDPRSLDLAPAFMARFVTELSSSGARAAEMPSMTNKRTFRQWFRFFGFFVKKMSFGLKLAGDLREAKGFTERSKAAGRMIRWMAGNAAAGFSAKLLYEMWKSGVEDGLEQTWAEWASNPWGTAAETGLYSILGGPFATAAGVGAGIFTGDDRKVVEEVSRVSPTTSMMHDVIRMLGGYGQYRDEDFWDAAAKFRRSNFIPIERNLDFVRDWMGMEEDTDLNDAHRSFWKARIAVERLTGTTSQDFSEERMLAKDVRDRIRKIVNVPIEEAMDRASLQKALEDALGVQGGDDLARRLRGSKYLDEKTGYLSRIDPGLQADVLAAIPPAMVQKLRDHDELVEAVAAGIQDAPTPEFDQADLESRIREASKASKAGLTRAWRKLTDDVIDRAVRSYAVSKTGDEFPRTYKLIAAEMAYWPNHLEGAFSEREIEEIQFEPTTVRRQALIEDILLERIFKRGERRRKTIEEREDR